MWCQWTCQSNLFSSATGQRPDHWVLTHTHIYTTQSAGTSPQAIPPVHPLLPLPLCLSFLIIFHFFCVQFQPHTALNCARALFRFSFIKRSARVVHTRLHPALVSLRAGVGGKSVCVVFFFFFPLYSCFSQGRNRWNVLRLTLTSLDSLSAVLPAEKKKKRENGRLAVQCESVLERGESL